MGDKVTPVWVRLLGAAVLIAMIAASLLIVARSSERSRPAAPTSAPEEDDAEEAPPPDTATDAFSPDELLELQECVSEDAALTNASPDRNLRKLVGVPGAPRNQAAAYADLVDIASDVQELRGFRYTTPIQTRFVSSEKVAGLAGRPFSRKETAAARFDDLALVALGVLRPGEHVSAFRSELVTDQVAGFYRPRADELVVPSPGKGAGLEPFDKAVLAHELEHALVDQRVGLSHLVPSRRGDQDGSLAALAVVEGSATLAGYRWTQSGLSIFDQFALTSDPRVAEAEVPSHIPSYLMRQFTFPYVEGLQFVCDLYDRGGWRLVNRAIRHPPATTLEILAPRLYGSGYKPPRIQEPRSPGPAWKHRLGTTFGTANWAWLLESPGGNPELGFENAEALAREWTGGNLHVWTRGKQAAFAVVGSSSGRGDLCVALLHWYDVSFGEDVRTTPAGGLRSQWLGEDQSAAVACPDGEIRLGIGPNRDTALHLAQ